MQVVSGFILKLVFILENRIHKSSYVVSVMIAEFERVQSLFLHGEGRGAVKGATSECRKPNILLLFKLGIVPYPEPLSTSKLLSCCIVDLALAKNFDVFVFTETWLKSRHNVSSLLIHMNGNYQTLRCGRANNLDIFQLKPLVVALGHVSSIIFYTYESTYSSPLAALF